MILNRGEFSALCQLPPRLAPFARYVPIAEEPARFHAYTHAAFYAAIRMAGTDAEGSDCEHGLQFRGNSFWTHPMEFLPVGPGFLARTSRPRLASWHWCGRCLKHIVYVHPVGPDPDAPRSLEIWGEGRTEGSEP